MSDVKANTGHETKLFHVESVQARTNEQPDVPDVDYFQALFSRKAGTNCQTKTKGGMGESEHGSGTINGKASIFG
jgi:hypothetical protein